MNLLMLFVLGALVLVLLIVALSAIRVVQQYERGVIFVLGRLIGAKGPGLFLVPPLISGTAGVQPEAVSGTDYAVCYLDPQRGTFSNTVWKAWFASDTATMLEGGDHSTITFLVPGFSFPIPPTTT